MYTSTLGLHSRTQHHTCTPPHKLPQPPWLVRWKLTCTIVLLFSSSNVTIIIQFPVYLELLFLCFFFPAFSLIINTHPPTSPLFFDIISYCWLNMSSIALQTMKSSISRRWMSAAAVVSIWCESQCVCMWMLIARVLFFFLISLWLAHCTPHLLPWWPLLPMIKKPKSRLLRFIAG